MGGAELGGLSGLTYNPETREHYAIVDRGSRPVAAFHTLDLGVDEDGWFLIDIKKTTPIKVKRNSVTAGKKKLGTVESGR